MAHLTQSFFCHLLERGDLARAEAERGRFRTYVLTCAQHFLANAREAERALKRGGGLLPISLDGEDPETRIDPVDADSLSPEAAYERAWAMAVIDGVTARLGREFAERNRSSLFEALKVSLLGAASSSRKTRPDVYELLSESTLAFSVFSPVCRMAPFGHFQTFSIA